MIAVSLIVLTGLVGMAVLRRRSAALRHALLAAALVAAAAVPLLQPIAPGWSIPLLRTRDAPATATSGVSTAGTPSAAAFRADADSIHASRGGLTFARAAALIWLAGVVASLLTLGAGFARLRWLTVHAAPVNDGPWVDLVAALAPAHGVLRPVVILQSAQQTLLVTWGWLRPVILLPASATSWSAGRMRIVFAHELAHIGRGDWVTQMLAELLRSIYWFNPLVWIASRRLRREAEQACDDAVIAGGARGADYAAHLVEIARTVGTRRRSDLAGFPAPAMVRPSSLERRVTAMLDETLDRAPVTRRTRVASVLVLLTVAVVCAGLGAAAQGQAAFVGSVVDPMNSAVPKVPVTLTNMATQARHVAESDDAGRFAFPGLPVGEYALRAEYPGFISIEGIIKVTGQDVLRTLALQLGSVRETINVVREPGAPAMNQSRAPRAPASASRACEAASTGGSIRPPVKLAHVAPLYPQTEAEGTVLVDGRIGLDGFVRALQVRQPANPALANAAIESIRQWQFDATKLNCVPVETAITVSVNFRLNEL